MKEDDRSRALVSRVRTRVTTYWSLIKSLQTGLLLMTGLAGYLSASASVHWGVLTQLAPSLFLAISGSTIMNMWWDRDIDARMHRTDARAAASGRASAREVLVLGLSTSACGLVWAVMLDWRYGLVVAVGWFCDVGVYTVWLKRRTCWAIAWGGIAGAMPILAGRVLATARLDAIGILLAASILFWIPTHTLTFSLKFHLDYEAAGIPTFPTSYGATWTRVLIAGFSVLAALAMTGAATWIGAAEGILALFVILSAVLVFLAGTALLRPSDRMNLRLYKYASAYMLLSMLLIIPARLLTG